MKAFVVDSYKKGGPLRLAEAPEPELRDDDVLVQVSAAGVNLLDSKVRNGEFKLILPYRPPFILGHDVAGTIVKAGARVKQFKVGDEVYARPRDHRLGTFAEFIAVNEADVALKPKNLSMAEAASIPLVGLTAWQALVEVGKVKPGQKVFIQAGSGGVGTFAIQLARHLGAIVATTASAKNHDLVKKLGATEVIDYKTQRFDDVLEPFDVIFDTQGGDTLERSFKVIKRGGTIVTVGGKPDAKFAKAWGLNPFITFALGIMTRKVTRLAREHEARFEYLFMRPDGKQLAEIAALLESREIIPVVDRTLPFAETKEALAYVESGRAVGKVVVVREG